MRSIVGVGMTPPNVLGTPNPASSVMMSRTFGACLGGTIRGAHQYLDCRAPSLITPPNFGSGAGSCLPVTVVVALGEPGSPVVSTCWARAVCAGAVVAASAQTSAAARRFCVQLVFILGFLSGTVPAGGAQTVARTSPFVRQATRDVTVGVGDSSAGTAGAVAAAAPSASRLGAVPSPR